MKKLNNYLSKLFLVLIIVCSCFTFISCGDDEHKHIYNDVITAPTCTEQGYTTHTCSDCGYSFIDSFTQPINHNYGNWVSNNDGTHTHTCLNDASHTETENCNYETSIVEPTCSTNGYTLHTCADCGYTYKDNYTNNDSGLVIDNNTDNNNIDDNNDIVIDYNSPEAKKLVFDDTGKIVTGLSDEFATDISIPNGVTGIDWGAFAYCINLESVTLPNSVTSIGNRAFYGCSSLTSITLPNSLKSIGYDVFLNCDKLIYNDYKNGYYLGNESNNYLVLVKAKTEVIRSCVVNNTTKFICESAFSDCENLANITIGNSVTSIGGYAFKNCRSLKNVTFEGNSQLTSIGENAFYKCDSIVNIIIPNNVTNIGNDAFYYCDGLEKVIVDDISAFAQIDFENEDSNPLYYAKYLYLSNDTENEITGIKADDLDGCTAIKQYAFCNYICLTNITLPSSVTSIDTWAFADCVSLTSIILPNSLTNIGENAFYGCNKLRNITLPEGLITIGESAFCGCGSLKSIALPQSLISIDYYAFEACSGLEKVIIDSISAFAQNDFSDNPLYYAEHLYLSSDIENEITEITAEDFNGCKKISDFAFAGMNNLTSIIIPNSVTSIGCNAFSECGNLTSVMFEENSQLTSIDSEAFRSCENLKNITIPNSVTKIGSYIFMDCSSLEYNEYENGCYLGDETNKYVVFVTMKDKSITNYTIHQDTKVILGFAFEDCHNLLEITLSDNVTYIGEFVINNCTKLTKINFNETKTQWNNIEKDYYWDWPLDDDYVSDDYIISCTDGEITK